MKYPIIDDIAQSREIMTYFGGYVKKLSCQEGSFYDMTNMTTEHFPLLSPRQRRGINKTFDKLQGIIDKDDLTWIDNGQLYINNELKETPDVTIDPDSEKTMCKMGAYIAIFPDKIWYNTYDDTYGYMEASHSVASGTDVTFQAVKANAQDITAAEADEKAINGHYKITESDGKTYWQIYSETTKMWANVATTYFKIQSTDIGKNFKKGDGVKITVTFSKEDELKNYKNIFVNEDKDNPLKRDSNFSVYDKGDDYITVVGILGAAKTTLNDITVEVERKTPDIAYLCECQNRLWACSPDGHEVYCCKQGDVTNWNCFAGISTDSWRATVGSDGIFTGAAAYMGNPIFFKENSLLKITISNYGAHAYKEVECRGVQEGSAKSLVMLNELLYFKSTTNVCYYDGNFPQEIGDDLGEGRYKNAVGGSINNRYYISMQDKDNKWNLFTFGVNNALWSREDDTKADFFCRHGDELFFVKDNTLYSINGTNIYEADGKEKVVDWSVESGWIGYSTDGKKYLSRMDLRAKLDVGSHISLYVEYDSSGNWEHVWNVSGKGTKTFAVPIRPKRCDHFRYKLTGHGDAKLYSMSKYYEEGSDL